MDQVCDRPLIVTPPIAPGHFQNRPLALIGDNFWCPILRSQSRTWSVLGAFVLWYLGLTQVSVKGLEDNGLSSNSSMQDCNMKDVISARSIVIPCAKWAALCSLHKTERGLLHKLWLWQWTKKRDKLCWEKGRVYFPDTEKFRIKKSGPCIMPQKIIHAGRR